LKRSNRLILLIGIVLAVVAFVGIVLLLQGGGGSGGTGTQAAPTELPTVMATRDIALGTQVRAEMLEVKKVSVTTRAADAFSDPNAVIGQIARTNILSGTQLSASQFAASGFSQNPAPLIDAKKRAMSVSVDQVTGVGTLIQIGDHVDAVVGFGGTAGACGNSFPVITIDKTTNQPTPLAGIDSTSVKLLVQNLKVVGTLLPPPPAQTGTQGGTTTTKTPSGTALNGQQEIVLLAVTPQQAELLKFAQIDACTSLILRSPKDYVDDAGAPVDPPLDPTTGVILKTLVTEYGVLPPQVIQTVLPTP
jgi:pilus assembly protein CpaB